MVYASYASSREATLDARRRLLAQCPRLIEELAEVTTNLERQTQRLLPGGTAALAASELLSKIEQTSRLLAVKDRKVRVVAVGQPREVLTTPRVAGYLLPANGNNP
jgi:hypothetical protein